MSLHCRLAIDEGGTTTIPSPQALGVPARAGRAAEGLGLRRGAALAACPHGI